MPYLVSLSGNFGKYGRCSRSAGYGSACRSIIKAAVFPFINELKDYDFEFRQGASEQVMRELASIFCISGPDILYGIHRKILMMEVFV